MSMPDSIKLAASLRFLGGRRVTTFLYLGKVGIVVVSKGLLRKVPVAAAAAPTRQHGRQTSLPLRHLVISFWT
jgi:hypothetical protein